MSLFKKVAAGVLGASLLIGGLAPVAAAPVAPQPLAVKNDNVQTVQDYRFRRGPRDGWRGGRHYGPREGWRGGRHYYGDRGYWRGHRGYRGYRHGYRRHSDGWWYPLAAFGAGAIIGGALAAPSAPEPVYRGAPVIRYNNHQHVDWCSARYRSFRASDNTFQPNNGPRRQCVSPYM